MNKLIKQAFTLIELLVVIAIIGILSGLIVVSMSGVTQKATIAKAQVFSNSLRNSLMLNLISEWRLDENTGTSTADSWSGGSTGTLVGTTLPVWTTDCVNGSCLQFSGDDYVNFGNKPSLSMGLGDATVSLWIKFDNAVAPASSETLVTCGALSNTNAGFPGYWIVRSGSTTILCGYFSDGTAGRLGGSLSDSGSLVADSWYNIVVVFNRDSVITAYINGISTGVTKSISAQQGVIMNYMNYEIGAYNLNNPLAGKIDEVRIYNAIMPTSQIKERYYAGLNKLLVSGGITSKEYSQRINSVATK
jgi:prepilin-type N-terminal cleavage/methylation domain-containing protein